MLQSLHATRAILPGWRSRAVWAWHQEGCSLACHAHNHAAASSMCKAASSGSSSRSVTAATAAMDHQQESPAGQMGPGTRTGFLFVLQPPAAAQRPATSRQARRVAARAADNMGEAGFAQEGSPQERQQGGQRRGQQAGSGPQHEESFLMVDDDDDESQLGFSFGLPSQAVTAVGAMSLPPPRSFTPAPARRGSRGRSRGPASGPGGGPGRPRTPRPAAPAGDAPPTQLLQQGQGVTDAAGGASSAVGGLDEGAPMVWGERLGGGWDGDGMQQRRSSGRTPRTLRGFSSGASESDSLASAASRMPGSYQRQWQPRAPKQWWELPAALAAAAAPPDALEATATIKLLNPLKDGGQSFAAAGDSRTTVFVKGLDAAAPEPLLRAALVAAFSKAGEVVQVRLPTTTSNLKRAGAGRELKGIAFIVFKEPEAKARVAELQGCSVLGRRVFLDEDPDARGTDPRAAGPAFASPSSAAPQGRGTGARPVPQRSGSSPVASGSPSQGSSLAPSSSSSSNASATSPAVRLPSPRPSRLSRDGAAAAPDAAAAGRGPGAAGSTPRPSRASSNSSSGGISSVGGVGSTSGSSRQAKGSAGGQSGRRSAGGATDQHNSTQEGAGGAGEGAAPQEQPSTGGKRRRGGYLE